MNTQLPRPQAQRRCFESFKGLEKLNLINNFDTKTSEFLGEEEEFTEISTIISSLDSRLSDNSLTTQDSNEILSILRKNSYSSVTQNSEYTLFKDKSRIPRSKNPLYKD
jgi:hypothetical protein